MCLLKTVGEAEATYPQSCPKPHILSGIPSMACGYSESEKFSDYVYLYYNEKDYMDFISMLLQEKLPTKNKNGKYFVSNNTWSHRAKEIHKILNTAGAF